MTILAEGTLSGTRKIAVPGDLLSGVGTTQALFKNKAAVGELWGRAGLQSK
jgi:hypothetical protein